jgi:hypothetical protein
MKIPNRLPAALPAEGMEGRYFVLFNQAYFGI